jgi:hypothetical protein
MKGLEQILPMHSACISGANASQAARITANCVLPPLASILRADSRENFPGVCLN